MSENFDDVNEEELEDELYEDSSEEQKKSEQSAKEKYDQAKDIADRIKKQKERAKSGENGTRSTSDGSASSRRSTADNINREDIPRKKGKGTSNGEETAEGKSVRGNTSPSGETEAVGQNTAMGEGATTTTTTATAEGTAATAEGTATTTTVGGTTAATTTAGGTAAAGGSAAAGGAAAAGGTAAAAWPVLVAILIIVLIIVIILLIIGAISFFTTVPGMMMDKITEISSGLWQGFKSFFEGNAAYITEEDQTTLAEYIENMGYDVVGYGFATPNEIQISTENTDTGSTETVTVQSKYLFAYLLADYNTYAIDSTVKTTISNFWSWLWGSAKPLTGMLKFDDASWLDITEDVEVDRDSKTVSITVWNPEIEWLNIFNTDTYTYSLEGWTGRYGKPLEFLLTLHIATMAPDLAYHVASDEEFDTKVHIDFEDVTAHVKLQYVVKENAIDDIQSDDYEGVVLWEIDGLEYLEDQIGADGTLILSPDDLAEIEDAMVTFDPLIGPTQYDDDVVEAIEAIGMTKQGLRDAVSLCEENWGEGKELKTRQPYITYVEKAWYKNIYFVINNSIRNSVTNDPWLQSAPNFDAYEYVDGGEIITDPYDFHPSADSDQSEIVSDTSLGVYQVLERKENKQITQKSQPLKGATNPRIKELFVGAGNNDVEGTNPKPEYYIYDGSRETAEAIEDLRQQEATFRASGNYTEAEVSEYINSIDDDDLYREIDFNKNSLTALTILENMQTEDADFILRDLKSLLVELKYFKASDLADKNVGLLDWIVPDYSPADWPNRKYEKQNYEYGTYIRSKTSIEQLIAGGAAINNPGGGTVEETTESGDGYSTSTKINNATYRNYKQYSGSYASTSFWGGTMSSDGCGPTAAAIVASGYGKTDATPRDMADIIVSDTTLAKVKNALNTYGINATAHTVAKTQSATQSAVNDIRASLNEGKPVIVLMSETTNHSVRSNNLYSGGGHFIVLLAEENGTLIMSNPGRGTESGNKDTLGLEAFVRDYMTEYSSSANRGYLIFDEAPSGSVSTGFGSGMNIITPGIGEVTKVSSDSITIKFTETNLVKDMTMTINGISVNPSISVGQMLSKEQQIGTTTNQDILVILRAPNKSIVENVEDYMPPPNSVAGTSAYYGNLTEDELEMFAAVLFSENGTNEDTMAAVANVVKNRALDTVHFTDVNTITDVLIAPGQYGVVHKVPGSGSGPTPGGGESNPPAGKRTFLLPGKGEYWITQDATDKSRQVAREVIDGVRQDTVSAQMGKLALYQRTATAHPNADSCCVVLGEIYSHSWGCLDGNHQECTCTLP